MSLSWSDLIPSSALVLLADPTARPALVMLIVAGVFSVITGRFGKSSVAKTTAAVNVEARANYQQPVRLPKVGNRGPIDRRRQQWDEPVTLAGVTVETKDRHIAIGAT